MGSPIDRTAKTALDSNLVNGVTSDAPKVKANNDVIYNYADTLNSALDTHAAAATLPHADSSVTGPKIRDGAVTTAKIADLAVTQAKIALGAVGPSQLATGLAVTADVNAQFAKRGIDVTSAPYNAVGDGVADDTIPIQNAINAANGSPVFFPAGTYLITDQLNITVERYSLYGCRTERGANALATNSSYSCSRIKFRPSSTSKYLISRFETSSPASLIGPFEHRNLTFDLGTANGFEFGREDINGDGTSDVVTDGAGQRYVYGVRFDNCAIIGTIANRASVSGVITRSGQRLIWMTKCFEAVIQDTSLYGGDKQIRTWGCDKPTFRNIRSQGAHLPFDVNYSGTFAVQVTIDNLQVEGWTLSPVYANCELSVSNSRFEQNDGSPTGSGIYNLTSALSITASVTAGSNVLMFSSSMNNILFPNLSIIRVTDGTNTDDVLVTAVSGTSVTVSSVTSLTWTNATATVYRIHGYGPILDSLYDGSFSNIACGASLNCPAFVYVMNRGSMHINNATAQAGVYGNISSMVVGNKFNGTLYLNQQMTFANCTPLVVAIPSHPAVSVSNWQTAHGLPAHNDNVRGFGKNPALEIANIKRQWIFTPGTTISNQIVSGASNIPFKPIPGQSNTQEVVWAWYYNAATPLYMFDESLPSATGSKLKITIRARSIAATGTINYNFQGNGGSSSTLINLTSSWANYEIITAVPAEWTGTKTTQTAIRIAGGTAAYIAGVLIEEVTVVSNQTDSAATDVTGLKSDFNSLLAKLRSAGIMN